MAAHFVQWIIGIILVLSSLGIILAKKPVHACLAFLLTLLALAAMYLQLSADFIGIMQILVYAGAILVIFMFVIVLFQDAFEQIALFPPKSTISFLLLAAVCFPAALIVIGSKIYGLDSAKMSDKAVLPHDFGTVGSLGKALYVDFFFPFEAVILLFLVAVVGALYIGKKNKGSL